MATDKYSKYKFMLYIMIMQFVINPVGNHIFDKSIKYFKNGFKVFVV